MVLQPVVHWESLLLSNAPLSVELSWWTLKVWTQWVDGELRPDRGEKYSQPASTGLAEG